jgi:hypothetical protein
MRNRALGVTVLLSLLMAVATLSAAAGRGDDANRKSKNGRTEGAVDGVAVTIEYGRPNVKGRQIWGALVPYGSVWRTGADEATAITFAEDVRVEGERLAAGTYGLFTIPGESEWTVIFNKVADFGYEAAQDALRVTVTPQSAEHVESLEFALDGSEVVLRWEQLAVAFEVRRAS